MIILGLDPSQTTGYALYDHHAPISAMRCGTIRSHTGPSLEFRSASIGQQLAQLVKAEKPDFAIIEQPPRTQYAGKKAKFFGEDMEGERGVTGLQSFASTNQIAAACATVMACLKIPFEVMDVKSWRTHAYGFGTRPTWARGEWKRHARQLCTISKIKATNDDMAEACWIALAGMNCQTFKIIRHRLEAA